MHTFILTVEYDGTRYHGFSTMQKGKLEPTISGKISNIIEQLTGEIPTLVSATRTEAGVHALKQVVSFQTSTTLSPEQLKSKLNKRLPQDIVILDAQSTSKRFHAALNATSRTWLLRIQTGEIPDLFRQKYTLYLDTLPNIKLMQDTFSLLSGKHDFKHFTTVKKKKSTEKELYSLNIIEKNDEMLLYLCGNDFLPHMPEILFQLLLDIGLGRLDIHCVPSILSGNLSYKTFCPCHALYLADITYTERREHEYGTL
ncbi:MAG: hypothetical protein IAA25_07345 [Candidatus Ruminococcus intestinipullorum]|nr:hypothetical protein [Candidatus Ruminococcus intestinipullorum]